VAELTNGSKIVLIIEYDGTNYHGSQYQTNALTIQEEIEKALNELTGKQSRIRMASRTDAGVHATGQVASFTTDSVLPMESYTEGLNHFLPEDISVKEVFGADESFDVRRDALNREYCYTILNCQTHSPIRKRYSHKVAGKLDVKAMNKACKALVGKHDLSSFVSSAEVADKKRTERTIYSAEFTQEKDVILFNIIADSFLPHQVRNTIGSLLKVGQGKMTTNEFKNMIEAKTPGLAHPTAPPTGLCLVKVNYPESARRYSG